MVGERTNEMGKIVVRCQVAQWAPAAVFLGKLGATQPCRDQAGFHNSALSRGYKEWKGLLVWKATRKSASMWLEAGTV